MVFLLWSLECCGAGAGGNTGKRDHGYPAASALPSVSVVWLTCCCLQELFGIEGGLIPQFVVSLKQQLSETRRKQLAAAAAPKVLQLICNQCMPWECHFESRSSSRVYVERAKNG